MATAEAKAKYALDALANLGKTPDQINPPGGGDGGGGYMGYPSYEAWLAAQQYIPEKVL